MSEFKLRHIKKSIALKIGTYQRLMKFLLELSREREQRLTFDDAINALLDEYEKRGENR